MERRAVIFSHVQRDIYEHGMGTFHVVDDSAVVCAVDGHERAQYPWFDVQRLSKPLVVSRYTAYPCTL